MPSSSADRNLLFGILALQMDFVSKDQLIAGMNAWVLDKTKPLAQILVDQRALDPTDRGSVQRMVHDLLLPGFLSCRGVDGGPIARSLAARQASCLKRESPSNVVPNVKPRPSFSR